MYSIVKLENLKLYDSPMIMDQEDNAHVPYVDDFEPKYIDELEENNILDRRRRTSLRRDAKYICMDHKSMHPSKAWWIEIEKVKDLYPHLFPEYF